ncbi:MAG: GNAT family N-acetyltransferase [Campylobacterota bacterium]|nr:GNAT family N-acetyltransferase [Campylobacterota bacterium]
MHQFLDLSLHLDYWDETIRIYTDSFPKWEREDTSNILKNIKNGTYKMFSYLEDGVVVGFYILDINSSLNYALFSFLAIKESRRGEGLGSKLCLSAIEYFHKNIKSDWLFIEAQQRQAELYKKLGFSKLSLDYRVPEFHSSNSVVMNLMLLKKNKELDAHSLKKIIKDIFHRGYSLVDTDMRIQEQIDRIDEIKLI